MCRRPSDHPTWPSQIHTPGTVIRATDDSIDSVIQRLIEDELHGVETGPFVFVESLLHQSLRGAEFAQVYWVEVLGEPKIGKYYDVDSLPANIVTSQLPFINEAIEHYKANYHPR